MSNYPAIKQVLTVDPMIDREKFLALRSPFFGTSAAACLFGDHPFMSAADYWLEKVAGTRQEETMAMRRGNHLEHGVAMWFAEEMDMPINKNKHMYTRGHLAATPDYWTGDSYKVESSDLVEIKTTSKIIDDPELYWLWQVQGQMLCTGAPRAHIVWVDASLEIKNVVIQSDSDMQRRLWDTSLTFMDGVKEELMPGWVEMEARHVIQMYPEPVDAIEAGEDGMNLVADYWGFKSLEKEYGDRASVARDVLFALAGNHDTITHDGVEIATLRPRKLAPSFNKFRFKTDHPGLYQEYMSEPTTTRALNIPKKIKSAIEGDNNVN